MIKSLSRFFSTPNPYKVLGIPENASKDQIKLAYYRIAKKYHPDINSNYPVLFNKEYFAAVTQAYKELESHDFKYQVIKPTQDKQNEQPIIRPKLSKFKVENDNYKKRKALFEVLLAVGVTVFVLLKGIVWASRNHSKKIINEQNELMLMEGLEREYDEEDQVFRFYPKDQ